MSFITYWLIHYYAFNFNNYFYQKCREQINPFHIHNYLVFSRIVAGSFSEKFSYTSHVFQWEIQLACQISWTTRKLYDRSHVFQREFRWLYHMSLCVINSEWNMIFIVVKIQSNISVTNLALLKVQEIQVLVLCLNVCSIISNFILHNLTIFFRLSQTRQIISYTVIGQSAYRGRKGVVT